MEINLQQTTKDTLMHVEKWNQRLSMLVWLLFGVLIFFESVIAILYCQDNTLGLGLSNQEYLRQFLLRPLLLIGGTLTLTQLIASRLRKKISALAYGGFILCTSVLIISEAVGLHYGINLIYALYVLPIIIAVIYIEPKILWLTYGLSVAAYLLTFYLYIVNFVPAAQYTHSYMDSLSVIGLLTAVFAISRLALDRVRELLDTAVEQRAREIELSHALTLDSLTKLYNHATFYEKLDAFILAYQKEQQPFSIIIMDIDNFKSVNDTYGHDTGNTVLLELVEIIRAHLQSGDLAFRYGGEEFAIITPDSGNVTQLAEGIRVNLAEHDFIEIARPVTVSMGICTYDDSFGGRREFFSAADKALYRAKRCGKNCIRMALSPQAPPKLQSFSKPEEQ